MNNSQDIPPAEKMVFENENSSLLKIMREAKNLTQTELANRAQLSRYQVQRIEQQSSDKFFEKIQVCVKALGYKLRDFIDLMEAGWNLNELKVLRCSLDKPRSETILEPGVKLSTYLKEETGTFLGQVILEPGKCIRREDIPVGSMVLGLVFEGTLVIDSLGIEQIHHDKQCFLFDGVMPFEFWNREPVKKTRALVFSFKYPQ